VTAPDAARPHDRKAPDPPQRPAADSQNEGAPDPPGRRRERKSVLLRLDPEVHEALTRWAADDLRSTNAHIEWLLRRAVIEAGRLGGKHEPSPSPSD
jgi:hypothetical protein